MAVNLIEAIYLLKELGIETVSVDALIKTFLQQPAAPQPVEVQQTEAAAAQPGVPQPPELPPAPVYPDYKAAKKAAKKGQTPVKEGEGYILA